MAGRRPKPTALKIATGNPGKRKLNKSEPHVDGIPIAPEHLTDDARRAWFVVLPMLERMGVLSLADGFALERLCETYAEVLQHKKDLTENGYTQKVRTETGDPMERQRPQVAMLADADRRFRSYLVEFGLTPAARSKVNASDGKEQKQNPAARFLGNRPAVG